MKSTAPIPRPTPRNIRYSRMQIAVDEEGRGARPSDSSRCAGAARAPRQRASHGRGSTRAQQRQNTSSHAVDTPAVVDHSRITPSALKSRFGSQMASAGGQHAD